MSAAAPAVLVMAGAPLPGACHEALEPLLGSRRCVELQAALIRHAASWAATTAPGAAFVAFEPVTALERIGAFVPAGVDLFAQEGESAAQRLAAAAGRVFALTGGPLLIVGTSLPWLSEYHATAAIGDLREGCDVVLGVAIGGGLYLLGVRAPQPRLFELAGQGHDGAVTRQRTRQVAEELGLEVGMLHYERTLDTPEDALAMVADPLLPPAIAAALRS